MEEPLVCCSGILTAPVQTNKQGESKKKRSDVDSSNKDSKYVIQQIDTVVYTQSSKYYTCMSHYTHSNTWHF